MTCAICMEDIDETISETNRAILSCSHEFHPKCILEWFKKSNTCPTCRESHMKKEEVEDDGISRESILSLMNTIGEQVHTTQINLTNITADSLRTSRLISSRINLNDITNSNVNNENTNPNSFFRNILGRRIPMSYENNNDEWARDLSG